MRFIYKLGREVPVAAIRLAEALRAGRENALDA
jgi:hypothetical protein